MTCSLQWNQSNNTPTGKYWDAATVQFLFVQIVNRLAAKLSYCVIV